jgi:hypothetical protein
MLLHVVFKRLYPDCCPKDPIKTIAEAEAIQKKSALLMGIFLWAPSGDDNKGGHSALEETMRSIAVY